MNVIERWKRRRSWEKIEEREAALEALTLEMWRTEREDMRSKADALLRPYYGGSRREPKEMPKKDFLRFVALVEEDQDAPYQLPQLAIEEVGPSVSALWVGRFVPDPPAFVTVVGDE